MYRHHPSWVAAMEVVASGRIGRLRAVQSWFSFYNDDPANIRNQLESAAAAPVRHRLLRGQPVADAVRCASRGAVEASVMRDPATGVDILTSAILEFGDGVATFTCSTRVETDQRVHVYGSDGRLSIDIPFNIPPDRPTHVVRDRRRRPAGGAGDRDPDLPDRGSVHRRGGALRGRRSSTARRPRRRPRTRSPTCASSSGSSRPGTRRRDLGFFAIRPRRGR